MKSQVQGATNTTVCEQFDPDTATAYLERALTKNALATYEAHLAACHVCRHYNIELARLMPAPMIFTENAALPQQASLKERLSLWFSGWRLGALAGFGAVAATVLVIAVIMNRPASEMLVATSRAPEPIVITPAAPSPMNSPASATAMVDMAAKTNPSAMPAATPDPRARQATATSSPAELPDAALPPPPPVPILKTKEERTEIAINQVGQAGGAVPPQNQAPSPRELRGQAANQAQMERAQQVPAAAGRASVPNAPAKPMEKAVEKDKQAESVADARRDDAMAKKSSDTNEPPKQVQSKSSAIPTLQMSKRPARLVRNVSGKSFHLENGFWTDTEYDAGKGLPVIRLQHDSDGYKQTLRNTPSLKQFFDLSPVIVVWQGKVYRVEKR